MGQLTGSSATRQKLSGIANSRRSAPYFGTSKLKRLLILNTGESTGGTLRRFKDADYADLPLWKSLGCVYTSCTPTSREC